MKRYISLLLTLLLLAALAVTPQAATSENGGPSALWLPAGHDSINTQVLQGLGVDAATIALVNQTARRMDNAPYNDGSRARDRYHAGSNYVQTLRFLYEIAVNYNNTAEFNHATFRPGYTQNSAAAIADFNVISSDITALFNEFNAPANNPARRAWIVMGMAAHLAGDIYSHRRIVPALATTNLPGTDSPFASGFHDTRFRASEFTTVSPFTRFWRMLFLNDAYHSCGGVIFGRVSRADTEIMEDLRNGSQAARRRGCWACVSRGIELGVLEFRDIKHVINNRNASVRFPDGVNRPLWQYYEDFIGTPSFYAARVTQSGTALRSVMSGFINDETFQSYWLMPTAGSGIVMDFLWPYARTVYLAARSESPNEGWLRNATYHRFSTFRCGSPTTCNFPGTGEHYMVAALGCAMETLPV
jgi:hypothetical protein